jgi:hypothetical protein
MPLRRIARGVWRSSLVVLLACLVACAGADTRRWQEASDEDGYANLQVRVPLPAHAWLVRATPGQADGVAQYGGPGKDPHEVSAYFRFSDVFHPDGSVIASIDTSGARPTLCFKSDYLEFMGEEEDGVVVYRRAFKRCVQLQEHPR